MRRWSSTGAVGLVLTALAVLGCTGFGGRTPPLPVAFQTADELPAGFPRPVVHATELDTERAELGRYLFYDKRLSVNGTTACASCHRQELAFTDGHARASGATGERHPRGAMSLANVVYNETFTWASERFTSLERQMLQPLLGTSPIEMGLRGHVDDALRQLRSDPIYPVLFESAFPQAIDPFTLGNIVRAIAAFERTLISGGAPYDRYVYWGEDDALTATEKRGRDLFFSDLLACSTCHAGFNLSGPVVYEGAPEDRSPRFHHNGLYDEDGRGGYPEADRGLFEETRSRKHDGLFRAPTLRNIAVTAPYMHDGSLATLEAVVDHYASGGVAGGAVAKRHRKSPFVAGFDLSPEQRSDLIAFLHSLTDETFLTDPRFADPFL